ncbi:putative phloem protein [Helianthus annuus]|nr:putative phloem protein [Helianthus annuus]
MNILIVNCYFVAYCFSHIIIGTLKFHTIAYLHQIWWLEVEGDLEFEFPAGSYSLFFRLQLGRPPKGQYKTTQHVHGWNIKPVRFQLSVSNGEHATSQHFLNESGKWQRCHVGDFIIENSYKPKKINFSMTQIDCTHQKGGLALDSVFICPKKLDLVR